MTILGHSLPEVKKAAVEFIFAAAALVAFFVVFDPALPAAIVAVVIASIGVLEVYNRPHSYDDISKAIASVIAAGVALYGFFHVYDPGEADKIIAIGAAVLKVGAVFITTNANPSEPS